MIVELVRIIKKTYGKKRSHVGLGNIIYILTVDPFLDHPLNPT